MEDRQEHLLLCEDKKMNKYAERDIPSYAKTARKNLLSESKELSNSIERETALTDDYNEEEKW